jgi:hypothetical protein
MASVFRIMQLLMSFLVVILLIIFPNILKLSGSTAWMTGFFIIFMGVSANLVKKIPAFPFFMQSILFLFFLLILFRGYLLPNAKIEDSVSGSLLFAAFLVSGLINGRYISRRNRPGAMANGSLSDAAVLIDPPGNSFDFFISYKVEYATLARFIVDRLLASGLKVWFDEYRVPLSIGNDFEAELKQGIRASAYCIVLSEGLYFASHHCRDVELSEILASHDASHILHINLEEDVDDPIFQTLGRSPTLRRFTDVGRIFDFIRSNTGFSIAAEAGSPEAAGGTYYKGTCNSIPYVFDASGWTEEQGSVNAMRSPGISDIGPALRASVEGGELLMNLYMGPDTNWESIRSMVKRALNHRLLQRRFIDFSSDYFSSIGARCIAVHLLPHREFLHSAFTYLSAEGLWQRKYSILLAQPGTDDVFEFLFTFGYTGSFCDFCRISPRMDRLVSSLAWPPIPDDESSILARRAFGYVEQQHRADSGVSNPEDKEASRLAIVLLKKAILRNPRCADAYNELAFIHGNLLMEYDIAERFARKAVETNPGEPKFTGTLHGIRFFRIKNSGTKKELKEQLSDLMCSIEDHISLHPDYPPAYFSKAFALALGGENESAWMEQLETAKSLYLKTHTSASKIHLTDDEISRSIEGKAAECRELAREYDSKPEM